MTACGQHHFERSENIVINERTQNDVTAEAVNDVMLRINDVLPLAKTMLHFVQRGGQGEGYLVSFLLTFSD